MAKPRRRQEYTPALLENLRFRFEETDESVLDIAASVPISHTTLRLRARECGWVKFVPPPLDLSPAAKLAAEAGRLSATADAAPPTPDPSPPLATLAGGGETETPASPQTTAAELSHLTPQARMVRMNQLMRAAEFEIARLRQKQALPQHNEDAKVIVAALSELIAGHSQIEHQLQDLERGQHARTSNDHALRSDDIDERRRRLAERIRAFVRSRHGGEDAAAVDGGGGR